MASIDRNPVALVSEQFESSADSSMEDEDWDDEELEVLRVAMAKLTNSMTSFLAETRSDQAEMKRSLNRVEEMLVSLTAEQNSTPSPMGSVEVGGSSTSKSPTLASPQPVDLHKTKQIEPNQSIQSPTSMTQLQIRPNQVLDGRPLLMDCKRIGISDDLPEETDVSTQPNEPSAGNSPIDLVTDLENDCVTTKGDDESLSFDPGGVCLRVGNDGLLEVLPKSRSDESILVKEPISKVAHQVLDKMSSSKESDGDMRDDDLTAIRDEVIDLFQLHFVFDPGIVEKEIEVVAGDFIVPSLIAHLKGGGDYLIIARYGLLKEVPEPSIDNQVVTKGFTSLLAAQWLKGKPKGKVVQKVECSGESPKDIDENIQLNLLAVATNYLSGCRVPSLLGINSYSILSLSLEGYLVPKVMPGRCLIFDCNCMSQIGDITMFDFLPARELWTCVAVEDNLSDNVREDKLGAEDAYEDIKLINSVRNFDAGRKAWVLTTVAGDPLILNYSDREGIDQVQLVFDPGGDHLATASAIRENKLTGGADIEKVTKTNVKLGKGKSSLVLICDVERQIKGLVRCFYPGFDVLIFDPEGASMVFDMKEKLTGLDKCSYPCSDMWIFDPGGGELQADHQV